MFSVQIRCRLVQIHLQGVGAALGFDEDHAEPRAGQVVFDDLNFWTKNKRRKHNMYTKIYTNVYIHI